MAVLSRGQFVAFDQNVFVEFDDRVLVGPGPPGKRFVLRILVPRSHAVGYQPAPYFSPFDARPAVLDDDVGIGPQPLGDAGRETRTDLAALGRTKERPSHSTMRPRTRTLKKDMAFHRFLLLGTGGGFFSLSAFIIVESLSKTKTRFSLRAQLPTLNGTDAIVLSHIIAIFPSTVMSMKAMVNSSIENGRVSSFMGTRRTSLSGVYP